MRPYAAVRLAGERDEPTELESSGVKTTIQAAAIVGLVLIAGVLVFLTAPHTQDDQTVVDRQVGELVEKARRLMMLYDQRQTRAAALQMRLASLGIAPVAAPATTQPARVAEALQALIQRDGEPFAELDQILQQRAAQYTAARSPDELVERVARMGYPRVAVEDDVRMLRLLAETDEKYFKTLYGPQWRSARPSPAGGIGQSPAQQAKVLAEAFERLREQLAANAKLLDQAEQVLTKALAIRRGQATGRDHPGANRLMGLVLYEQAGMLWQRAMTYRTEAERLRSVIDQAHRQYLLAETDRRALASQPMDPAIASAREAAKQARAEADKARKEAERLEGIIGDLKRQVAQAEARAAEARRKMDELEERGYDPTRPETFAQFAQAYRQQAEAWRTASAQTQALKFGTLRNARLAESLDLTKAELVPVDTSQPISPQRGLRSYEQELATVRLEQAGWQAVHEALTKRVQAMEQSRSAPETGLRARIDALAELMNQQQRVAGRAACGAQAAVLQAAALEDQAIKKAASASTYLDRWASLAERRINRARSVKNELGADKSLPRLSFIIEDRTPVGQARIEAGSALLFEAMLYLHRTRDLQSHLAALKRARQMGIAELRASERAEPEAIEQLTGQIETAIGQATEEAVAKAQEALERYQAADGPLKSHWTVQANVATAYYVLAQLAPDEAQRREYRLSAIESYTSAIKGREDSPFVADHLMMLQRLQAMGG